MNDTFLPIDVATDELNKVLAYVEYELELMTNELADAQNDKTYNYAMGRSDALWAMKYRLMDHVTDLKARE